MKWKNNLLMGVVMGLCVLAFSGTGHAASITVDDIIYEAGIDTDPTMLSGTVDMDIVGNQLLITLTNTSLDGASSLDSNLLLTGVGFNLGGLDISGGSASAAGQTAINWTHQDDVSGEWGYANEQIGQFNTVLPTGTVDTLVTTMESSTNTIFDPLGSIVDPVGLSGPAFGLLSNNETGFGTGLEAINNSLVITLDLGTALLPGDLLDFIDDGNVILSFGSSDSPSSVPEPTTVALLGIGIVGLAGTEARRRRKKKAVDNS